MKRYRALAILLALCLALTGCVIIRKPGPEQTTAPVGTAQPQATATAQKPPETPQETLAERLRGVYRLNRAMPAAEEGLISVDSIGGVVFIENIALYEGSVYSFWAQEIWPEDAAALGSTSASSVAGVNMMFSTMSNDGNYWDAATDITITVTENGLAFTEMLDGMWMESSYTRVEDEGLFHALPPTDMLPKWPEAGPSPVGDWCFEGEDYAAWLSLHEDGSMRCAVKTAGMPLCAYTGIWGAGEDGTLSVIAERMGCGTMPYEWLFDCSFDGGALVLTDVNEYPPRLLPADGPQRFSAAAEEWAFPGALFYAAAPGGAEFEPSVWEGSIKNPYGGEDISYYYECVELAEGVPGAAELTARTELYILPLIREQLTLMDRGEMPLYTRVTCETHEYEGLCSLVYSMVRWVDDEVECDVLYFDSSTGAVLGADDVLRRLGLDRFADYLPACVEAGQAHITEMYGDSALPKEEIDYLLDETEQMINYYHAAPIIAEDGTLWASIPIVSIAGKGYYYRLLPLDIASGSAAQLSLE